MLQNIDGVDVYVVDFDTMPDLPITYANEEEKPYALALGAAISTGVVTESGKYGIQIELGAAKLDYTIYKITE